MTRARLRWILAGLMAVGLVARIVAFFTYPGLHPDEFFQYLEPAWWHWQGYGWQAWEWGAKLRSWIPPSYYGAWMVLLSWVGVHSGARMHQFFQMHWAILSVAYVWFGWRAGRALAAYRSEAEEPADLPTGWRSGLWAAALCAALPTLAHFAPHTSAGVPAGLLMVWGYTLWVELRRDGDDSFWKAFAAGVLLCLGACLRIPWAPLALAPALDWLVRRKFRCLGALVLGALPPLALYGLVDYLTWGNPLQSSWAFIDYNFLQGRAVEHGAVEYTWYSTTIGARFGFALVVVVPLVVYAFRKVYPWLVPAVIFVAYLSTQRHQEERYILLFWPLMATVLGTALGHVLAKYERRSVWAATAAAALLVVVFNVWGIRQRERLDYDDREGLRAGQAWAGEQPDISGLLVDGRFHLSGGYLYVSKNIPLNSYNGQLVRNPIFNYCVLRAGSPTLRSAKALGFKAVWERQGFVVVRRRD